MSGPDIVEELATLYVWPQSVADHHADILTPRQIEMLYAVGNVAERAAATITALQAEVAAKDAEIANLKSARRPKLSDAPCKECGYNGPGYYQPDTHPCAALERTKP